MSKISLYALIVTGLSLLFYFFGIIDNLALNLLLSPSTMGLEGLGLLILKGTLLIGATIGVGILTQSLDIAAMVPLTVIIAGSLWSGFTQIMTSVIGGEGSLIYVIAMLVMAPAAYLFFIELVDFWRGR